MHTAYIQRRRYRLMARAGAVVGGLAGAGFVGLALAQAYAAGEKVPPGSWLLGAGIVAVAALLPWGVVRWRWRRIRQTLVDSWD